MPITINIILDVPEYLFITIGVVAFAVFSRIIDRPFLGDHMVGGFGASINPFSLRLKNVLTSMRTRVGKFFTFEICWHRKK